MQFADILHKFRTESFTQKDKGTQFERLMRSWLLSDPRYSMLTEVWLWEDFPSKADFGGKDTGIDLVAHEYGLNGKSAVDGIKERYAVVAQDSKSLIVNDPNDWGKVHHNLTCVFDRLLSVLNMSVQTIDIVNSSSILKL